MRFAVENMYPWRYRDREMLAYAPDWDVTKDDYRHFTIDLSHSATSRTDALEMVDRMGDRLGHVHLADGKGSAKDEHLVPGRGSQPCAELLERLALSGFDGHVVIEVNTRRAMSAAEREADLAEALAFTRLHLASAVAGPPAVTAATPRRRGRPPRTESADTPAARDRILAAAREEFSERGYDKTSVRGIAKAAGVDSALVHHYFGTKDQVFEAAVTSPSRPAMRRPDASRKARWTVSGSGSTRFIFGVWENPATRTPLLAIVRSAVNNEAAAAVFRRIISTQVLRRVAGQPGRPGRGTARRAGRRPAGGHRDAPVRDQGGAVGLGGPGADHREGGAGGAGPPHRALSPRGAELCRSRHVRDDAVPYPQTTGHPAFRTAVQPLQQRAYARVSVDSL